ncbi:MAG: hypothetical protein JW915_01330 [Chitinispirillaceae bacterium]|nr:hypothetical protein [Chitinispirillaceae bacterium]
MGVQLNDLAEYKFYPFVRRGLTLSYETEDNFGTGPVQGTALNPIVPAGLELGVLAPGDDAVEQPVQIEKNIGIAAPVDVIGIEAGAIIRTIPRAGITNFCADFLAGIEFFDEDFPWRFTPVKHDEQTLRLRPWITLLVLSDNEYTLKTGKDGKVLSIIDSETYLKVMPDIKESWAFAHTQFAPDANGNYDTDSDLSLSRLLSSRKMKPDTAYTAFIIPSFEAGRRRLLNLPMDGVDITTPAWSKTTSEPNLFMPLSFPVYYQWSFSTSHYGDFETLCEIIKPDVATDTLGKREMDIGNAAAQLELDREFDTVGFEGSLKPVNFERAPRVGGAFENSLVALLSKSADFAKKGYLTSVDEDIMIVPPVYGATYQPEGMAMTGWCSTLNKDPRNRAAASIGAKIVRKNQDRFVEEAWDQVDEINKKNEALRNAAFVGKISNLLMCRHIHSQDENRRISLSKVYHSRIPAGMNSTLSEELHESNCPDAVVSLAFRKSTRPTKRMLLCTEKEGSNYFEKARKGALSTAPATAKDPVSMDIGAVTKQFDKWAVNHRVVTLAVTALFDKLKEVPSTSWDNFINVRKFLSSDTNQPANTSKTTYMEMVSNITWSWKTELNGKMHYGIRIKSATYKKFLGRIYDRFEYENFGIQLCKNTDIPQNVRVIERRLTEADINAMETRMKTINAVYKRQSDDPATDFNKDNRNDFTADQDNITAMLNPRRAMMYLLEAQFGGPVTAEMAYPELDIAFYRELIKESKDLIIPNFNTIKQNSLLLLETNTQFVESVLAGANTEMGKELLWREYPTDRRGSYFRKFWDKHDALDVNETYDIKKITGWNSALGENSADFQAAAFVVLVVRADLFKAFPDTIVFALEAEKSQALRTPDWDKKPVFPKFTAEIEDVKLFAFNLKADQAKGGGTAGEGYFFLFQQRPGQMEFGLDAPQRDNQDAIVVNTSETELNELTWAHLVNNIDELPSLEHLRLFQPDGAVTLHAANSLRTMWQNGNGGSFATMLIQQPIIYARHATDILP